MITNLSANLYAYAPRFASPAKSGGLLDNLEKLNKAHIEKLGPKKLPGTTLGNMATAPFDWYAVGKAAIGHGTAAGWVQGLGGVHVLLGVIQNGQAVASNVKPEDVNAALKEANGNRDLNPADCKALAAKINHVERTSGVMGLINEATTGAAIYTGHPGLGALAIVMKFVNFGVSGVQAAKTLKAVTETLANQAAPPAAPAAAGTP